MTTFDEISESLMEWSEYLDDENLGSMSLTGSFGYMTLHGQEADETLKAQKYMHSALQQTVDEEVWMDAERVKESEGELTDQAVFDYFERNIDKQMFAENFLVWLADEMEVDHDPW